MFPANDIAYLKQVLEDCGTVSHAVAKILGDEETPSSVHGMERKNSVHYFTQHDSCLVQTLAISNSTTYCGIIYFVSHCHKVHNDC